MLNGKKGFLLQCPLFPKKPGNKDREIKIKKEANDDGVYGRRF